MVEAGWPQWLQPMKSPNSYRDSAFSVKPAFVQRWLRLVVGPVLLKRRCFKLKRWLCWLLKRRVRPGRAGLGQMLRGMGPRRLGQS